MPNFVTFSETVHENGGIVAWRRPQPRTSLSEATKTLEWPILRPVFKPYASWIQVQCRTAVTSAWRDSKGCIV
jgi:hypothetical protein